MWSWRLSKIKKSIANSKVTESEQYTLFGAQNRKQNHAYFFTRIARWQYLLELIVASNVLAMVLTLAEAGSWQSFQPLRLLQYILFINWIVLAFVALVDYFQDFFARFSQIFALTLGFVLLQMMVLMTTIIENFFAYWATNTTFSQLSWHILGQGVVLHLSYGVLLGAFCLRYMYVRDQWMSQQYSELNARIQAMQARIHPHFLFNSLNSVVSLISLDPNKAETMLINLSRLFRASFQELKLVTLYDEIELTKHYLDIEHLRLGDRLQVEWKVDHSVNELKQVSIPLLTLQPLLENSIFHGVEKMLNRSTISILVEILQNKVNIVITNPYSQDTINLREGSGIALENVKQRLKAYYGKNVKFQVYGGESLYTTVVNYQYKAQ